ncbi:hypothetical protein BDZ45DRAFT_698908 [Acephala macrosclerotiorum]|nr:hypothetical protein BDZ45DRAFT_698908 [Acephala macrosclerotiorum]
MSRLCVFDSIVAYNKVVDAGSVAGRFYDGFQIACLTSGNYTDADSSNGDEDITYCLLDSQDWVGSDVIRPDCTVDPTDPSCTDPADVSPDNERLANLYGDDVLCSDCFVQLMYQRLISPYLPDHDYSDYLIEQYQDILDVCNYTDNMPELVIRAPPVYLDATPPPLNLSSFAANTTCTSQTIVKSTLDPNANCNTISQAFNAATGDVQAATGSPNCTITHSSFCLPEPCALEQVPSNASCDSLAASFSTANLTVSTVQLLTWNPNINGLCDSLTPGDYVCAGAPGGSYIPPTPPPGNSSDAGQQRGGDGGTPTNPAGPISTAEVPSPIQTGIVVGCTKFTKAVSGDLCYQFASDNNITTTEFYAWNTILGSDGSNCGTEFQAGYYYCVTGPSVSATSTSSAPTASSSCAGGTAPPEQTQAGIACNCDKWVEQTDGVYCADMASAAGITLAQLYALNPALNGDCSGLWGGYAYCIGPVPTATTTISSTAPTSTCAGGTAPPEQTQAGISCKCNKWVEQTSGVYCADIATAAGITLQTLYSLNPALNGDCSGLWAGYAYCIGLAA